MVGEAEVTNSVKDVTIIVRSCHAEIRGMNVERLIHDVKYYWNIDLKEFAYRNDFGPYPNFNAVVNFIRSIEGATLVPMRDGSGNFFVHFRRPECQSQIVSMIHASKPKKRNRPPFRNNNGQSSNGNRNQSSYSNGSQSLHRNNNQRSTKGAKTPLVYKFYQTNNGSKDSKDMENCQSSKHLDKEQLSKTPSNQQSSKVSTNQRFPSVPVIQQLSENLPETDNETFENSEFARWLRARSGQPKQSDISKDEPVKSRRSVAPYLLKSIFDECLEKHLENVGNFPEKSKKKQKDQEFVSTKWGEMSLKNNMMRRKFNDPEPTGREKEENVGNKVRGDNETMGFPSPKFTKELATSPIANDEEIIKFTVNKEDKSELNEKGKEKLDCTKDALFDEDDEDVLPTMEEVKIFLGEQTQDKEINEYANDLKDDPDVIKDDGTFFRIVDNLLEKEKKFKFPAMLKLTYVGEPPRLHKVKALN
uniref:HTH OST-type domain-containing protein n=1 Tax=Strongyloides venezuelensis TaxID=75913 RepID=A0A0K0EW91_STRVS